MSSIHLKRKHGERFFYGHPWVFSNELMSVPKLVPGARVALLDDRGEFLASGYYNPHSLISFRALSRNPADRDVGFSNLLMRGLEMALERRKLLGFLDGSSFRLVFGEADRLPGLIVDAFVSAKSQKQTWVFQPATAGAELLIEKLGESIDALKELCQRQAGQELEAVLVKRNSQSRKREGLELAEPTIFGDGVELNSFPVQLQSSRGEKFSLRANLAGGQKTGFFLDQRENIDLLCRSLKNFVTGKKSVRVLDLCSYVGHWSARVALELKALGVDCELQLVDSSEAALEIAQGNLSTLGFKAEITRADVMVDLKALDPASYDIVICDPPALIKSRAALEAGKRAYAKLNGEALKLVKDGGLFVTCSCSGLLNEQDFVEALDLSAAKAHKDLAWIRRGFQSADHPVDAHFPEGQYLKCLVGIVNA